MTPSSPSDLSRRRFLACALTAAAAAGFPALRAAAAPVLPAAARQRRVAFNTANLVARFSNYRFELKQWNEQVKKTVASTDEKAWADICREIAAAGYRAVEIWVAHVDPGVMTDARAKAFRRMLDDHGLEPIGLGGALTDDTARVCRQLGIPGVNGNIGRAGLAEVRRVVRETGLHFYYENHPEKSVDEIKAKIDGGSPGIALTVDTGWLGTQGLAAPETIRALGPDLVKHVHLKDVKRAGAHETCPLGEGVVDIPGAIRALQEIGYTGWYSWEDEPEDRNPLEIARPMREYLEQLLA